MDKLIDLLTKFNFYDLVIATFLSILLNTWLEIDNLGAFIILYGFSLFLILLIEKIIPALIIKWRSQ